MHDLDYYGDQFKWFVGVVKELSTDGTKVRVRVYGIHHMEDVTNVSDGDLPWAVVLRPTTSNTDSIVLRDGDWVMGFFADGHDCMQPVVVGVIGGSTYSDATSSGVGAETGGGGDGGGSGGGGSGPTPDINVTPEDLAVPGNDNEHKSYNYLRSTWEKIHGDPELAHIQTCGIMGHINVESRFRLSIPNRGECAYGLCQWRDLPDKSGRQCAIPARKTALFKWAGLRIGGSKGPGLTQQLSFIFHELETSYKTSAYSRLMGAKNIYDAVYAFSFFEGHAGVKRGRVDLVKAKKTARNGGADWGERLNSAQTFDLKYKNAYTPPGSTETRQPNAVENGYDERAIEDYQNR